jgi:hypothetical protein
MNGGPVLGVAGNVRGIGVATLTGTMPDLDSPATMVANGIRIGVEYIQVMIAHSE